MIQTSPSKQNYVTVLAIYDDPAPRITTRQNGETSTTKLQIPVNKTVHGTMPTNRKKIELEKEEDHCVEVKSFSQFPPSGLQIQAEQSGRKSMQTQKYHQRLNFDEFAPTVHFAVEQKEKVKNNGGEQQNWRQNNTRKSRISDTFLDAKERIENYEKKQWSTFFEPTKYRFERIILSNETCDSPMGIEISAVPNPDRPSHLLAVEVRTIEQKGRLAQDGRLRVGDQIVEINGIHCEQISFARARLYIRELQSVPEPSISFFRKLNPIKNVQSPATNSQQQIEQIVNNIHVLQKGNTSKIGQCQEIKLIRRKEGFGFNYAGRMNAKKEHLYYVKGLRSEQGLAVGDRILKINGIDLSNLDQADVTALFKSKQIGQSITLLISRTAEEINLENKSKQQKEEGNKENVKEADEDHLEKELAREINDDGDLELLQFEIPLNETPGAGLGISVKAQRKASTDMGLYIRSILHGSAAYRDGRLCINDRLVGVEAVNLLKYPSNGEALDTFMRTLTQLPHGKSTVRVYVVRAKNNTNQLTQNRWGSESELNQTAAEEFIRDSTMRRSISEKRSLGLYNDPSHLITYQRIVHQRQTSAPALSARSRRSLHVPATLNNNNIGTNRLTKEWNITTTKTRPKSTFYTNEDVDYSKTLPSPKSNNTNPPIININSAQQQQIPISKSQPESLTFLTRSGTIPATQNGENAGGIRQSGKRRSSLGSGLLKLFSGRSREEPSSSSRQMMYQQQQRPPPPPYNQQQQHYWPHPLPPPPHQSQTHQHFQHFPHQPSTSTNHPAHLCHHYPSSFSPSSFNPTGSEMFRHPQFSHHHTTNFHGPGSVEVPHWPHDAESDLSRQRQRRNNRHHHQQQAISQPTIINHSMFGSHLGGQQQHPTSAVAFSPTVSNANFHHWQHSHRPPSNNKIGKTQPSAVFYDDFDDSNWVIRC